MKYYKTYTFTTIFFLIVLSIFVGVLFFWSDPQPADAVQMPQQAVAKQTLNNDNGSSGTNLAQIEDVSDGIPLNDSDNKSLFMQNPLGELFPIEISADNSGNLPVLTSETDLDTKSGTRIIQSGSADAAASAVAADASGTGSTVPAAAGGSGSSGAGSSGSSGTGSSDSTGTDGSGSSGTGGSGSSGGGGSSSSAADSSGSAAADYPQDPHAESKKRLQELKWVYVGCNFADKEKVLDTKNLIPQIANAGYNGIVIADTKFDNLSQQPVNYFLNLRQTIMTANAHGIEMIPQIFCLGHANGLLANDVSLAEAMPVTEMKLKVSNKKAGISEADNLLKDCPFDETLQGRPIGWDSYDAFGQSLHIDYTVYHSGGASYRFDNFDKASYRQVRLMKKLDVEPLKQYRITAYIKTEDVENPEGITVSVLRDKEKYINFAKFEIAKTQDWTRHSIVFNSQEISKVKVYIGGWGIKSGRFWIDDITMEECLGVNLVRREGCPVKVTDQSGKIEYTEGEDYEFWSFPKLGNNKWLGSYHMDTIDNPIIITNKSKIKEGQIIKVSYYHAPVVGTNQVGICLTHKKTYDLLKEEIKQINKLFNPRKVFIGCDEMRVIGQCGLCRARKQTSGEILADTIKRCKAIIKQEIPDVEIYTWSDMFDPYTNANNENYYYCRGTTKGSWEGLDSDIRIVDWAFVQCEQSLNFFNTRGHTIIIAGFYDRTDVDAEMDRWLKAIETLNSPNVRGFMYTTWHEDYSKWSDYMEWISKSSQKK